MPSASGHVLISPDSHIIEKRDLWLERLPAALGARLPTRFKDVKRDGTAWGPAAEAAVDSGASADRRSNQPIQGAGRDPSLRIREMERDGLAAEVLYPTEAMHLFHLEDGDLQEACFRVYNDNLLEYCQVAPDRIYGIGLVSVYNIDNAIRELERCKKAGMVGGMVWMTPHKSLPFSRLDHYDRLWAAAQEMGIPISLHINTGFDFISLTPQEQREDAGVYTRAAVNERLLLVADALTDLMFSGSLARYPGLKIVIAECEICWLPPYLQQWDFSVHRYNEHNPTKTHKELLPSEYFARQIYATFLEDYAGGQSLSWWEAGQNNCMWSTDFPHSRTSWPHSRDLMGKELGHLSPEIQQKVVHDNAIRLYGFDVPELAF